MVEEKKEEKSAPEKQWWEEEFQGKWWEGVDWIKSHDTEPSGIMLFIDYMLDKAIITPDAVKIASLIPHRLILLEIVHPTRGTEQLSFMVSPTSVNPGVPDAEPDLVLSFNYYDLARFLLDKENDFTMPFWLGRARIYGNLTVLVDLADILEVAKGKKIDRAKEERPFIWPVGHP
ncbi:MAG TPA: hypothetical protein VMV49_00925 [Candidatus Deferrimicrobium sp.]|nr:hypothetical protein [Candidatus Deferrimicrobium sp.]